MKIQAVMNVRASHGNVPAVEIIPKPVRSGAVLLHAYGECKEQMLWLAYEMAKLGVCSLAIDLAGHGENPVQAGAQMLDEVEAAIEYMRQEFELVGCGGAGLGGRLALMSSADYMAAIAPSIISDGAASAALLKELGPVAPCERQCLLLYGEHDAAELVRSRSELNAVLGHADIRYISNRIWPDIADDNHEAQALIAWANTREMAMDARAVEITARWLAQMPGMLTAARRVHAE